MSNFPSDTFGVFVIIVYVIGIMVAISPLIITFLLFIIASQLRDILRRLPPPSR